MIFQCQRWRNGGVPLAGTGGLAAFPGLPLEVASGPWERLAAAVLFWIQSRPPKQCLCTHPGGQAATGWTRSGRNSLGDRRHDSRHKASHRGRTEPGGSGGAAGAFRDVQMACLPLEMGEPLSLPGAALMIDPEDWAGGGGDWWTGLPLWPWETRLRLCQVRSENSLRVSVPRSLGLSRSLQRQ